MERTIYTERLYSLGDFKNIKFSTALTGIPEGLALSDTAVGLIMYQQALFCEISYRKYYNAMEHVAKNLKNDPEAVMEFLLQERTQTYQELLEEINNLKKNEKETE